MDNLQWSEEETAKRPLRVPVTSLIFTSHNITGQWTTSLARPQTAHCSKVIINLANIFPRTTPQRKTQTFRHSYQSSPRDKTSSQTKNNIRQPVCTGTTAGDSNTMASQSSSRSRNQSSPSSCLPSHPPSQQTQYPTAEDVERKYQEAFIARHMPSEARNMESNTTSPTTPAHRAQYPSISLDLPSPQPFRLPLAGISASESEAGELSKFHSLENDGHFSEEVSELSNIRQSLGGFTVSSTVHVQYHNKLTPL
jgi:hypothetical protein